MGGRAGRAAPGAARTRASRHRTVEDRVVRRAVGRGAPGTLAGPHAARGAGPPDHCGAPGLGARPPGRARERPRGQRRVGGRVPEELHVDRLGGGHQPAGRQPSGRLYRRSERLPRHLLRQIPALGLPRARTAGLFLPADAAGQPNADHAREPGLPTRGGVAAPRLSTPPTAHAAARCGRLLCAGHLPRHGARRQPVLAAALRAPAVAGPHAGRAADRGPAARAEPVAPGPGAAAALFGPGGGAGAAGVPVGRAGVDRGAHRAA
ncbi:hypothetical protein DFJ74DRAFT_663318 [Hyaloraphidium curvatum]|nr:hypothetical protein DFJ74DRAFT_663318 [Hyaloraphidium curvatum]